MMRSLYDQDILLWVEETVAKLKAKDFESLDLENLIEEVESLGISQRKELLSRLTTLIEHLLKRIYIPMPDNYRGWENTIREQRRQLNFVLSDAPSLKSIWLTSFDRAWQVSLQDVRDEYSQINFPDRWLFSQELEAMLNNRFWEEK
jgi:hypothetical protein